MPANALALCAIAGCDAPRDGRYSYCRECTREANRRYKAGVPDDRPRKTGRGGRAAAGRRQGQITNARRKARANPERRAAAAACAPGKAHRWKLESPSGPTVAGVCAYCGQERAFASSDPSWRPDDETL